MTPGTYYTIEKPLGNTGKWTFVSMAATLAECYEIIRYLKGRDKDRVYRIQIQVQAGPEANPARVLDGQKVAG